MTCMIMKGSSIVRLGELSTENCHCSRSRKSTYSMSQMRNRKGKKKNTKKKTRMDEENGTRPPIYHL